MALMVDERPPDPPGGRLPVDEQLLTGGRLLRRAFLEQPFRTMGRQCPVFVADGGEAPVILIQRGTAYRSCTLPDGRRAILDLLLPGDFGAIDHVVFGRSDQELTAASELGYRALSATAVRDLMTNPAIALRVLALMSETQLRVDRHIAAVARLDARERLVVFLLDIYDRLRRRDLISRPTFNLPLTQDEIADHLGMTSVHLNRTLRRLRKDRLVLLGRQVVMITDLDRLRAEVSGIQPLPGLLESGLPVEAVLEGALGFGSQEKPMGMSATERPRLRPEAAELTVESGRIGS